VALRSASFGSKPRSLELRLPKRHAAQKQVVRDSRRWNVLSCGRRWGKTTLGLDVLVAEPGGALDGQPVAWFAPNSKLFNEVWLQAVDLLRPVSSRVDSQQNRIDLLTGGHVDFWTLHNTDDPGRGRKYARVFIDEAAVVPSHRLERQWNAAIRPTLTDLKGDAWFGSTPTGMNYYRDLWLRGQDERYSDWASWQMPTTANPFIDASEVLAAKAELPDIVFQQEFEAQFVDMAGARVKREWLRHGAPPDKLDQIVMGVDLAISTKEGSDYTACVLLARSTDGATWVLAAERTRAGFHDVVHFVRAMAERYNPAVIAIEQVQYQAAVVQELLRKTNLPVRGVRPDRDKLTRFLPLEARYEQGLVWHAPNLRDFEDELLSFPEGAHDDLVDAAAYAFANLHRPGADLTTLRSAVGYRR
jgi:predicted phage terminase large subunit-like protein